MRHRLLIIILVLFMSMVRIVASAATAKLIDGIYYLLDENKKEATVTYYKNDQENVNTYKDWVVIPQSIFYGITSFNQSEYRVTSIGKYAFAHCSELLAVTIPNSVTSIDSQAFLNCTSLTRITIPESVTSVSDSFYGCSNLRSVAILCNITSISGTFRNCSKLTSIVLPNSITTIGAHSFSGCTSLTSITIPENVTSIGDYAFEDCNSLPSITIPNNVRSLGKLAFTRCRNLTSVIIGNGVSCISNNAFSNCTSLASITIPNSVTSIEINAFGSCTNLTSITIPSSIEYVADHAFWGCSSLTDVFCYAETYPITHKDAFDSNIKTMTLHVPETSLETYKTIIPWSNFGNIVPIETSSPAITFADENVKTLCVANWDTNNDGELSEAEAAVVTDITDVFYNNVDVTSFNELQYFTGLTNIGKKALYGCLNLTSVIIPNNVTCIEDYAFACCI